MCLVKEEEEKEIRYIKKIKISSLGEAPCELCDEKIKKKDKKDYNNDNTYSNNDNDNNNDK